MRVSTKVIIDIATNTVEYRDAYEYNGQVVEHKGAKKAEKQVDINTKMQQTAFDAQQKQLNELKAAFSKYTTGPAQGFDPSQLADMNAQAIATNAGQFNSAGAGVRSALLARGSGGGNLPVGGDYVRGISSLMGARAGDLSSQLSNIRLQNAQQSLVNRFNAGSLLSGNAATLTGTQGVAGSAASSALGDYIRAKNTGFLSSFTNALGGSLGKGLGAGITGGIGGMVGGGFGTATANG